MTTYRIHYIDHSTGQRLTALSDAARADAARADVASRYPLFAITITAVRTVRTLAA